MGRIFRGVASIFVKIRTFCGSLLYSLENYLRSKVKMTPVNLPRTRRAIIDAVLSQDRFQEVIRNYASEQHVTEEQATSLARSYLFEIAADQNYMIFPFWESLLSWVFNGIYEGLVVDERKLEEFRRQAGSHPIVFVPNHRSHMDYLILNYLFYQHRIPMPLVCGGNNLSFWPMGPIGRKSGAFFIRRSYEGNKLYASTVQAYIEQLIRDKCFLEFFIEGTRSRTGKLLPPRMGILTHIVESYLHGAEKEILLVPTAITYDSVLEEKNYLEEHAGQMKNPENRFDLVRLTKYLKRRSGKVYIQFGETLSLKEWSQNLPHLEKREMVEKLAYQLTHTINKSFVVTPRSMVAAALLSHPQKVISERGLLEEIEPLRQYLQYKGCLFSETLLKAPSMALKESVRDLTQRHLIREIHDEDGVFYLIPEEKRPLLDFYKNGSLHFLASLATFSHLLLQNPKGAVSLTSLEEEFRFFKKLFKYEFTFSQRQPLTEHLQKITTYLEQRGMIRREDQIVYLQKTRERDVSQYATLIRNYIDGYFVAWKSWGTLGYQRIEEKEIIKWLLRKGNIYFLREKISHSESVSRFLFQNALLSFRDLGILVQEKEGWGRKKRIVYRRSREVPAETLQKMESFFDQR